MRHGLGRLVRDYLVGGFLVALLVGCLDLTFLAPREPVTVRFAGGGPEGYLAPLIEEFQRTHKNVKIEVVSDNIYRFEQLFDIDVILVPQFILPQLIENAYPISLNAFMQGDDALDPADFYPATLEALRVEGQQWPCPTWSMLDAILQPRPLRPLWRCVSGSGMDLGWVSRAREAVEPS